MTGHYANTERDQATIDAVYAEAMAREAGQNDRVRAAADARRHQADAFADLQARSKWARDQCVMWARAITGVAILLVVAILVFASYS